MGNISSPSPGPRASRTRPRGPLSPQGEGFVTEILRGENEKTKAAALLRCIEALGFSSGLAFVFINIPGSFVGFL